MRLVSFDAFNHESKYGPHVSLSSASLFSLQYLFEGGEEGGAFMHGRDGARHRYEGRMDLRGDPTICLHVLAQYNRWPKYFNFDG